MPRKSKSPFIIRSEDASSVKADANRRSQIISELSDSDIERVAGGTNNNTIMRDWDPDSGSDSHNKTDYPMVDASFGGPG